MLSMEKKKLRSMWSLLYMGYQNTEIMRLAFIVVGAIGIEFFSDQKKYGEHVGYLLMMTKEVKCILVYRV